jgi:hypothetical protein
LRRLLVADRDVNLEAAEKLVSRTVKSVDVSNGNEALTLELDDGSRIYVDALLTAKLEIGYVSPQKAFEIDRSIMEEDIVDQAYKQLRDEGQIPQLYDDRHVWTQLPPVSGQDPASPWVTHAARVELGGGVLPIYRTNDGRRHVDPSDVKRVFDVEDAADVSNEEIGRAIRRVLTDRERSEDSEQEDL